MLPGNENHHLKIRVRTFEPIVENGLSIRGIKKAELFKNFDKMWKNSRANISFGPVMRTSSSYPKIIGVNI